MPETPINVTVVQPKEGDAKPGIKTSEFWLSMFTNALCLFVMALVAFAEKNPDAPAWIDSVMLIVPLILSAMVNMGYGNQRIAAKADAALSRYAERKPGGDGAGGPVTGAGIPATPPVGGGSRTPIQ